MTTLITGATGWVGGHLVPKLDRPVVTSRSAGRARDKFGELISGAVQWQATDGPMPTHDWGAVDRVVNLMGDSIADGRWNEQKKQSIRDSRVLGTRHLVQSLLQQPKPPEVFVSASAVGYYGDHGNETIDESTPASSDFLGTVCADWEAAAQPLVEAGVRVVWLRIGIVLGQGGGALEKMLPLFRWGLGGRLGSGDQWMSWIHIDDLIDLILFALDNQSCAGPLNAVSPNPIRNRQFTTQLGNQLGRPTWLPAPKFGLRMMLGEFADFLLASQRVMPVRAEQAGFQFKFPDLNSALNDILQNP